MLITGCSSGIGAATARRLAAAGKWTVYATARRPEKLSALVQAGCKALALDVTDDTSMADAVTAVEREHGAVGVLINNAGYSLSGALETLDPAAVRRQFETNVFGPLRLCQLVLPGMRRQRRGRIVALSSMGGRLTLPGGGAYHATKYALEALSDALRFEVRAFGVKVIVIEPGLIRTGFGDAAVGTLQSESDAEKPYGPFEDSVRRLTVESYQKGPLAALGGGPDDVARVIERAIRARRPHTRYPVTTSARLLLTLRRLLPDRLWDAFLRGTYPEPTARSARSRP